MCESAKLITSESARDGARQECEWSEKDATRWQPWGGGEGVREEREREREEMRYSTAGSVQGQ